MSIIMFDNNEEFIKEAKVLEYLDLKVIKTNPNDLVHNNKIDMLISPADSFGYMNGGINKIYKIIFPDIQTTIKNHIKKKGQIGNMGHSVLPIGSAMTVSTNQSFCPYLIYAPIMYLPGNNIEPDNIFLFFLAILHIASKNDKIIACPGLSTDKMSSRDIVEQFKSAIHNFKNIKYANKIKYKDDLNLILYE